MVVLATGYQVRCILWEQVAILNKDTVFMWIKIIYIDYICEGCLQPNLCFLLQIR